MSPSDRIAYQTYNDVQSINARRRDMWTVIAEAGLDRLQRALRESGDLCRCGRYDFDNGSVVCWVCEEVVIPWDVRERGPLTAATVPA